MTNFELEKRPATHHNTSPMAELKKAKEKQQLIKSNKQNQKPTKHEAEEKLAQQQEPETPSSRAALKSFFTCKEYQTATTTTTTTTTQGISKKSKKIGCSGSICKLRDMQRPEPAPTSTSGCNSTERTTKKMPLGEINAGVVSNSFSSHSSASVAAASTSSSSLGGSFRGMHLRRLSGCYECHSVIDPISGVLRDSSLRATICPCPDCGEIFTKADSLEVHQAVRHAVSELGSEDTSRNIVEIIFQSSWLKKQKPVYKIDRILKVHNVQKTLAKFEDYRDSVKSKTSKLAKKHPRCNADGNELLRFHCTTFKCSLGLNGATNLCNSIPQCNLCSIVRDGFKVDADGRIQTMATSGRAHDAVQVTPDTESRAMLVCRVIAGKVKRNQESLDEYDSVAGTTGMYSNLDELFVINPRAILPCFVVIYHC